MSIKLRTTIITTREDWAVARVELLGDFLRAQKYAFDTALFAVAAGDREPLESADPSLSILHREEFEAMWLASIDKKTVSRPVQCEVCSRSPRDDCGMVVTNKDISGRFDVAVAFEAAPTRGRLIAECSVDEPAGGAMLREPAALTSVQIYVRNVATWLSLLESDELEGPAMKRSVTALWRWSP